MKNSKITEDEVKSILKNHSIKNSLSESRSSINVRNFTPRSYQLTLITKIVNQIMDGKTIIVANLPTGSGKSFIAISLLIVLDYLGISKIDPFDKGSILTFRNNLFDQYEESFKFIYSIKGKSNYTCIMDYSPIDNETLCIRDRSSNCPVVDRCEYYKLRLNLFKSKLLMTNYNWFIYNYYKLNLNDVINSIIFDEAHNIFTILGEFLDNSVDKILLKNKEFLGVLYDELSVLNYEDLIKNLKNHIASLGSICNPNDEKSEEIENYRKKLLSIVDEIALLKIINDFNIPTELSEFDKIKFLANKLFGFNTKKIRIFLSATINKDFFMNNLYSGDPDKVYYTSMDPIFDKDHRKIFYYKSLPSINKGLLDNKNFIKLWNELILMIMNKHQESKGFIYVNSYKQVKLIKDFNKKNDRFIFNDNSSNFSTTLNSFISDKTNKVLVSPNIQEGYDFKDDISRFQIIAKIPFMDPSIIKSHGEDYYYNKVSISLLQLYGRSIRSMDDYADTYILDNSWKLLENYLPKWFLDSMINMDDRS